MFWTLNRAFEALYTASGTLENTSPPLFGDRRLKDSDNEIHVVHLLGAEARPLLEAMAFFDGHAPHLSGARVAVTQQITTKPENQQTFWVHRKVDTLRGTASFKAYLGLNYPLDPDESGIVFEIMYKHLPASIFNKPNITVNTNHDGQEKKSIVPFSNETTLPILLALDEIAQVRARLAAYVAGLLDKESNEA